MKKRIITLLLVAAMALSILGGCTSGTTTTTDTSSAPAASSAASSPATDAAATAAATAAPADTRVDYTLPLTATKVTLTFFNEAPGGAVARYAKNGFDDYLVFQEAEKRTGIHIEFHSAQMETFSTKFNLMIASGEYTDLIPGTSSYAGGGSKALADGVIIALNDYMAKDMPNYSYYRTSTQMLTKATQGLDGTIYSVYELMADSIGPFFGPMIRQDWLDNLKLSAPTTYDDYYNVLKAFKTTYSCSTPIMLDSSMVGSDNSLVGGYGIASMLGTEGATGADQRVGSFYIKDGVVKSGLIGQEYLSYLTMLKKWYDEGLISPDFIKNPSGMSPDGIQLITTGQVGIFYNGAPMMSMYASQSTDKNLHITAIPDAVQKTGDKIHLDSTSLDFGYERVSVTSDCKNVDLALKWCDYLYSKEGIMLTNYGVEGNTYTLDASGNPQYTEVITNNPSGIAAGDAITFYTGRNSVPSWDSSKKLLISFNTDEAAAFSTWSSVRDSEYTYPNVAYLTQDETDEYSKLATEYETYALEMRDKFVTGEAPLSGYADYEAQVEKLGLTRNTEIKQTAYDRYSKG